MNQVFKNHPDLTEFFQTSDGQAFYTENAARTHARTLKNKTVVLVQKSDQPEETKPAGKTVKLPKKNKERDELVARYAELYGKAPSANSKVETLKKRIEEKEAELKAQEASKEAESSENTEAQEASKETEESEENQNSDEVEENIETENTEADETED